MRDNQGPIYSNNLEVQRQMEKISTLQKTLEVENAKVAEAQETREGHERATLALKEQKEALERETTSLHVQQEQTRLVLVEEEREVLRLRTESRRLSAGIVDLKQEIEKLADRSQVLQSTCDISEIELKRVNGLLNDARIMLPNLHKDISALELEITNKTRKIQEEEARFKKISEEIQVEQTAVNAEKSDLVIYRANLEMYAVRIQDFCLENNLPIKIPPYGTS